MIRLHDKLEGPGYIVARADQAYKSHIGQQVVAAKYENTVFVAQLCDPATNTCALGFQQE